VGGLSGLRRVVEQLQGVPLPASVLESQILRARLPDYTPAWLDQLGATGEFVWAGAGGLARNDGWIVLAPAYLAASNRPHRHAVVAAGRCVRDA
jgi:ATP-dependent Lhr-like helicase